MKLVASGVLLLLLIGASLKANDRPGTESSLPGTTSITGFRDVSAEQEIEKRFLAAPDAKLAEEHLRILTQAPHIAGSPEDKATAEYVARKFREAGLETEIVEYKVWLNYPTEISVDLTAPAGVTMQGPRPEQDRCPACRCAPLRSVRRE
jgi:N-acetylated-alpha-linked acidic dipeptidase